MSEDERLEIIRQEIERIRRDKRLAPYLAEWDRVLDERRRHDFPVANPPFSQKPADTPAPP